jgi:DNA helicase-2/ATP-dependent DNA helicase PcrA
VIRGGTGVADKGLFQGVATHLDYLVAFNRRKRINAGLSASWETASSYLRAREVLDNALAQDLILDGVDDPDGIQVIVLRGDRHDGNKLASNFVWRDDAAPYRRSRKILTVAVTRAKVHATMVQQVWPQCPIMSYHDLVSAYAQ